VVALEGGYNLTAISASVAAVTATLLGDPPPPLKVEQLDPKWARDVVDARAAAGRYWPSLGALAGVECRARSHRRFALPLSHFIPESLTYSVPLFLKRQCDRTLGRARRGRDCASDARDLRRAQPREKQIGGSGGLT
jgi:hypothetical protein